MQKAESLVGLITRYLNGQEMQAGLQMWSAQYLPNYDIFFLLSSLTVKYENSVYLVWF